MSIKLFGLLRWKKLLMSKVYVISDIQSSFILVNIEEWMYILVGQIQ